MDACIVRPAGHTAMCTPFYYGAFTHLKSLHLSKRLYLCVFSKSGRLSVPTAHSVWTHQQYVMCRWPQRRCVVGYRRSTFGRNSERLLPPGQHSAATCTESAGLDEQEQRDDWRRSTWRTFQWQRLSIAEVNYHSTPFKQTGFFLFEDDPHLPLTLSSWQDKTQRSDLVYTI